MENDTATVTIPASEYENLKSRRAELEALVKYYEDQLRLAKHRQFGASSEKSEYDQHNLFNKAAAAATQMYLSLSLRKFSGITVKAAGS